MPSKLEHEFMKLRGEVSETKQLYTDTIASLKDKITVLETKITALDADLAINKQKADRAISKAIKAVSDDSGSLKKSGGRMDNNCWIDNFQASDVIALKAQCDVGINIHDSTGVIIARIGSTAGGIKSNIIKEYTVGTGVTIDGTVIKDGLVDGLDPSGVAAGADVTADNAPQAHKTSHDMGGSDVIAASKINATSQGGSAVSNDMYFNSSDKKLYIRTGGSWYRTAAFTIME